MLRSDKFKFHLCSYCQGVCHVVKVTERHKRTPPSGGADLGIYDSVDKCFWKCEKCGGSSEIALWSLINHGDLPQCGCGRRAWKLSQYTNGMRENIWGSGQELAFPIVLEQGSTHYDGFESSRSYISPSRCTECTVCGVCGESLQTVDYVYDEAYWSTAKESENKRFYFHAKCAESNPDVVSNVIAQWKAKKDELQQEKEEKERIRQQEAEKARQQAEEESRRAEKERKRQQEEQERKRQQEQEEQERKRQQEQEEQKRKRQEAEKQRRINAGLCVNCGKPLGFMDKITGKKAHARC